MNCAAISAVLQSSTFVKSYNSSEEQIISFKRTKTNHDKLPCETEQRCLTKTRQITLHTEFALNFQVVFFENNFQEFGTLNAVCEEIMKLHIFIESRQEYFKKELIFKQRCGSLFCYLLFWLHSSSLCHAT